jgi:hypothetical protein
MADPECVITYKKQAVDTWEEILADAEAKKGNQLWLGPANGGLDHVTALKIWDKTGMMAKWIPFKSGGQAIAALLGEQGVAYVGNPGDILGNDDLKIAVISNSARLKQFPDVPTFKEFGITGLDNEFMWRGFVLKKGTPAKVKEWYDELFQKVTDDPDWRSFWEKSGIDVTYRNSEEFTKIVYKDKEEFSHYLQKIGIISTEADNLIARIGMGKNLNYLVILLFLIFMIIAYLTGRSQKIKYRGIMIPVFLIFLSLIFFVISYTFPSNEEVGPSVVPRLWIFILIPLNIYLIISSLKQKGEITEHYDKKPVYKFIALLIAYLTGIFYLGYFISTFLFLFFSLYMLGYRKYLTMLLIDIGWLIFSYIVFYKMIFVPLPMGILIEAIF